MNISLKGKIALITGATGQLGRIMSRTLASCGADIAVCYNKNSAMADQLVSEIKAMNCRAAAVQADITNENSTNRMREKIKAALGDPDIVVNNAVIQYEWKSVLNQCPDDFQNQFDSCVMQSVYTAKAFLPAMMAKGSGRFIGINSECSAQCSAKTGAYATAKKGMDGLYRVLANEAGAKGVTVNQVAPGWVISDKERESKTIDHRGFNDLSYIKMVPLARRGTDQEVANVVLFLASDLASFVTGVCIPVSGGNVMV
ncbi:MAG: SDR family oxidoreductase [Treponema sp.]|nr:SDR family oxidoreductase [Treponema sp.]